MCLIIFSWKNHPKYPLILAANRDEFYNRKTRPAQFWEEKPGILAGKDLEAGGTWMGISKTGRIAMITNYRDLSNIRPDAPSRGKLVLNYLTSEEKSKEYLTPFEKPGNPFNGYNLIVGNPEELFYQSNYSEKGIEKIPTGVHGLSNALLNTPWPKLELGKKKLQNIIKADDIDPESLFTMMYNDHCFPDKELPDTGIGIEKEKMLSSMFIKSPNYGSRCSTVLLIDLHGNAIFVERTYNPTDFSYKEVRFQFNL